MYSIKETASKKLYDFTKQNYSFTAESQIMHGIWVKLFYDNGLLVSKLSWHSCAAAAQLEGKHIQAESKLFPHALVGINPTRNWCLFVLR